MPPKPSDFPNWQHAAIVALLHGSLSVAGGFSVVLPFVEQAPLLEAWSTYIGYLQRAVASGLGFYVAGAIGVVGALPLGLALLDLSIFGRRVQYGWVVMLAGALVGGCSATLLFTILVHVEPGWVPRMGAVVEFALRVVSPLVIALWALVTVPAALIAHWLAWATVGRRQA